MGHLMGMRAMLASLELGPTSSNVARPAGQTQVKSLLHRVLDVTGLQMYKIFTILSAML
jgi:hypothetical protein